MTRLLTIIAALAFAGSCHLIDPDFAETVVTRQWQVLAENQKADADRDKLIVQLGEIVIRLDKQTQRNEDDIREHRNRPHP